MIKFHEQHQSGLAQVSLNHRFQLSESACLLRRFCEFNQIQPNNCIFQCGHDSVEWHGSCHAKTLDLESSGRHSHPSSSNQGPVLESTGQNLGWDNGIVGRRGLDHEHLFRAAIPLIVPPVPTSWSMLV